MKSHLPKSLSLVLLMPSMAHAALLSQDSFSAYPIGELPFVTNPATTGYIDGWVDVDFGNAEPAVTVDSLVYAGANYVNVAGNKVSVLSNVSGGEITASNSGRVHRLLDGSLAVTDLTEGTLYLSFLFRSGQETGATVYQMLSLYDGGITDAERNFDAGLTTNLGQTGTEYNFGVDNAYTSTGVAADTEVHLMVMKFELSATAASDAVTVWIDPVLGAGDPAGGTTVSAADFTWDRLVLSDYDGNSCDWDEIRWGTSFDSVTVESFLPAVPEFTLNPLDYFGFVDEDVVLTAVAQADPAPTYQWQYSADGVGGWGDIDGATESALEILFAQYADNGFYRVVATNANDSAVSSVAELSLLYPDPEIFEQPRSVAVEAGGDATFSVGAVGLGNLTYQWYKDGEMIPEATSDTLLITDVQLANEGDYDVEITDDAAEEDGLSATTVLSNSVTLTVFEPWSGLVSHEPFDINAGYLEGLIATQTPAVDGYVDAWTDVDFGDAGPTIMTGSLIYANSFYLGSSGDKVGVLSNTTGGEITTANSGRAYRLLEGSLMVGSSTTGTRYFSFLMQSGQETGATTYQTIELKNSSHGDSARSFDIGLTANGGQAGTEYDFGVENAYTSTGVVADANVHLFVVKFEFSAESFSDRVTVWVDPTLGGGEPAGGVTVENVDFDWDRIVISDYDGNSAAWDEFRWGSTFDSVTLNPNPSNTFDSWIAFYPGVGSLNGFEDDADGDGIKNGIENLFGTDPNASNAGIVGISRSGNMVSFEHPASATPADDVTGAYVWSTDLATFHADGATVGDTTVTFDTSVTDGVATVTATISGTVPERLFLSLQATQTAP